MLSNMKAFAKRNVTFTLACSSPEQSSLFLSLGETGSGDWLGIHKEAGELGAVLSSTCYEEAVNQGVSKQAGDYQRSTGYLITCGQLLCS